MAKQNKTTLKGYFETGDIPSQTEYGELIDSQLNLAETGTQIAAGTISASALIIVDNITTNNITASGDISASGTIYANDFKSTGGDAPGIIFHDDLNITGSITVSGSISSSGTVEASAFTLNGVPVGSSTDTFWNSGSSGNIFYNGGNIGMGITTPGEKLTVVGNVSASGIVYVEHLFSSDDAEITDTLTVGTIVNVSTSHVTASGNISASGNLSATGDLDIDGKSHFTGHVTASGNISVGGTITTDDLFVTDDLIVGDKLTVQGDTALGNAITDTHQFTGHITASGNISASGNITADKILVNNLDVIDTVNSSPTVVRFGPNADLTAIEIGRSTGPTKNISLFGPVTASGNISASGNLSATGDLDIDGKSHFTGHITASGNISADGTITTVDLFTTNAVIGGELTVQGDTVLGNAITDTHKFNGHITASGDISASGDILASSFKSHDQTIGLYHAGSGTIRLADTSEKTRIDGTNIKLDAPVTASGDISSSGTIIANEANIIGHITSSGNISASGIITAEGLLISDDATITDNLTIGDDLFFTGHSITVGGGGLAVSSGSTPVMLFHNSTSPKVTISGTLVVDSHITASGNISSSGTVTANAFVGNITGDLTGEADTVATIAGLAPNTATTQATQGAITSLGTLTGLNVDGNITASGDISSSGTVTANAFIGNITGNLTGEADTVATIAGLAPNTATTQATQASITTAANLTTVGALDAGSITSGFTSIDVGAGAITTTGAVSTGAINATGAVSASTTLTGLNLIVTGSGATQGNITATGTGSFAHIIGTKIVGALTGDVVGDVTGDLTGEADTVATIAGLAPNTATTQATQGAITSLGTLTGLNVDGNITASGDISSSGTVTGLSGSLQHLFVSGSVIVRSEGSVNPGDAALKIIGGGGANDDATLSLRQNLGTAGYGIRYDGGVDHFQILGNNETRIDFEIKNSNGLVSIAGDISGSGDLLVGKQLNVLGSITASGNISSSGDVYADDYLVNNVSSLDNNGTQLRLGYNTTYTKISLGRALATTQVAIEGNITASGAISASGTLIANRYVSKTETVAAAGSDISDAALLPKSSGIIFVTTDDAAKGVKLPAVSTVAIGSTYTIHNTAASTALEIYPTANDKIFPLADDAPATVAANTAMVVTAFSADGYVGYFTTVIS